MTQYTCSTCYEEASFYVPEVPPHKNKEVPIEEAATFLCKTCVLSSKEVFYPLSNFFVDLAEQVLKPVTNGGHPILWMPQVRGRAVRRKP